ncbi:MAG: aldo/keto reductase [Spirochaetaceae bacterium]|nr:aldo/keto reductase [Spirochaetaceae bacterium]
MTSMNVHNFALGLASLGRPGYINLGHGQDLGDIDYASMQERCLTVLDAAYDAGIRHIDAARSYGSAEDFLALWMEKRRPADLFISSKWGYRYTADWKTDAKDHEIKDHSLSHLQSQWLESHERLGSHLNLYQIHSATLKTGVLDDAGVMNFLGGLKNRGMQIGLSLSGTEQSATLEKAFEIRMDGVQLFNSVQATCNVLESSVVPALKVAHESGWLVIVKEALANGRLTHRGDCNDFLDFARKREVSPDALALAYMLANPFVSRVLLGPTTIQQLESNLGALQVRLSQNEMEALSAMREEPADYWKKRSALEWN